MPAPTTVIAIDAGKSTGVAVVTFNDGVPPVLEDIAQFKEDDYVDLVDNIMTLVLPWSKRAKSAGYVPVVVIEQFDLRPHNQFVADLTPVKINAVLGYLLDDIVWQTPGQAKGLVKDKTLKSLDMWPTGKTVGEPDADDARDALRHAIHYGVTELKDSKTTEIGWAVD